MGMKEQKKILVVDDDPQLRRLMELTLRREGYDVITADTGTTGVQKVIEDKPDLILMDVMMPDMDGFDATRRIRRLPEGRHIPIIFLSALGQVDAKVKGLRVGGDDYVTKPVNIVELVARIEAHLRPESPITGQLFTVFGSKGGVGTTTVVVNLALALRRHNPASSILLIDWQRPLGDVGLFLGLLDTRTVESLLPYVHDLDEEVFNSVLVEHESGLKVLLGCTDPASATKMSLEALSNVVEMALMQSDFVLLDGGAFFAWPAPPLVGKDRGSNLCLLTPELTAIRRALHTVSMVNTEDYDLWFVLNRDGMSGGIPHRQIESQLGTIIMGRVPETEGLTTRALNAGQPVYLSNPRSNFARAIDDLATRLHEASST